MQEREEGGFLEEEATFPEKQEGPNLYERGKGRQREQGVQGLRG